MTHGLTKIKRETYSITMVVNNDIAVQYALIKLNLYNWMLAAHRHTWIACLDFVYVLQRSPKNFLGLARISHEFIFMQLTKRKELRTEVSCAACRLSLNSDNH